MDMPVIRHLASTPFYLLRLCTSTLSPPCKNGLPRFKIQKFVFKFSSADKIRRRKKRKAVFNEDEGLLLRGHAKRHCAARSNRRRKNKTEPGIFICSWRVCVGCAPAVCV
jgi:hypothetical protein